MPTVTHLRRWRPQSSALLVLLVYAALTVVMTWPIAGRLGTHIPASAGDAWVHQWTFEWVKQSLISGESPYYTNLLFYPEGVSLLFHNIAWLQIAAWLPLQALVGGEAAYSLMFMAIFVLNGFATYLLVREITDSILAAFVSGLIVAFWPYTLSHHNHPNLILLAWIPLALLFLKRLFERKRIRDALFAGVFIALIGLTRWQLLVMGGLLIGLFVIYQIVTDRTNRTPRTLGLLLLAGLLAMVIMAPLLAPVVRGQLILDDPDELFVKEPLVSTDLLSYLLPNRYHPLWGEAVLDLYDSIKVKKRVPFIGYTTLVLAIIGTAKGWPRSRFWLLAGFVYVILALGPQLTFNGRELPIPLPYKLVEDWFLIKIIRRPERLNVFLSIPVAVLAGFGIVALRRRLPSRQWLYILATVVIGLILVEYVVRYRNLPLETPEWYEELAKEPEQFGILGIPMNPRAVSDKAYMYYQLTHGKPIVEGHVSRMTGESFIFIDSIPLLKGLRPFKYSTPTLELTNVSEQLRPLAEANVRYLILHKDFLSPDFLSPEEVTAWKEWLIQEPLHEDDELVVYRTDPQNGRDFSLNLALTAGPNQEPGIGPIRASVSPDVASQGDALTVSIEWGSDSEIARDYAACIDLVDQENEVAQSSCQPLAPGWPTSGWKKDEMVRAEYGFVINPYLNPGVYTVMVSLVDEAGGTSVGDSASLSTFSFRPFHRTFDEPNPDITTTFNWDDIIFLPGFDLKIDDAETNSLAVTFYWGALKRMNSSYTNFVHLVDPQTKELVAQADVIPRGWTYPTSWWEAEEWVEDTVQLSMDGVSPGTYDLFVGWYDLETGERVPVYSETGESLPDEAAPIGQIQWR